MINGDVNLVPLIMDAIINKDDMYTSCDGITNGDDNYLEIRGI